MLSRRGVFHWIILAIILVCLFSVQMPINAEASELEQELCFSDYDWRELELGAFVLVYPLEQTQLVETIYTDYQLWLNELYQDFSQVFGTELIVPVVIRMYPRVDDYYCLNPLATPVSLLAAHAHIGEREIALLADRILSEGGVDDAAFLNGLRHELAVLFTEQLSGGYAPPGLLLGVGMYAERPAELLPPLFAYTGNLSFPEDSWQLVWEDHLLLQSSAGQVQADSIAAYLIDVYGWEKFVDFLADVERLQSYRQALIDTYGQNLNQLQSQWETYYSIFTEERWRVNIFHDYDLVVFQELIASGAYQDAIPGLEQAVSLLVILGTPEQEAEARELLEQARLGKQAGELAAKARHALLSGLYLESYTAAVQAREFYSQLGDTRRIGELEAYIAIAKEILDLRAGLEVIRDQGVGINPLRSLQVFEIGQRLLQLGDAQGVEQAESILFILGTGQNAFLQFLISVVVLVSTGLILRRILGYRKDVPPEGDLL